MRRLRSTLVSFWVLIASFSSNLALRFGPMWSQAGNAKPEAVTAAGAGAVGLAAALRGCRSAAMEATSLAGGVGRTGIALTSDAALSSAARSAAILEEVGLASAPSAPSLGWRSFSSALNETTAAKGLTSEQLALRLETDPAFRLRAFEEMLKTHPERAALHQPLVLAPQASGTSVTAALDGEAVILYDGAGRPLSSAITTSVEAEYRAQAARIFEDVIKDVPVAKYKSEQELRTALKNAFASKKADYSFDVSTGKLKLKVKTSHGEVTGEVNAYGVAKKLAAGAGSWGLYELLTEEQKPTAP